MNSTNKNAGVPEWIRLPRDGDREPNTGLSRSVIWRMIKSGAIESKVVKSPLNPKAKSGVRVVRLSSLLSFLEGAQKEGQPIVYSDPRISAASVAPDVMPAWAVKLVEKVNALEDLVKKLQLTVDCSGPGAGGWRASTSKALFDGDEVREIDGPGDQWNLCAVIIERADGRREIFPEHKVRAEEFEARSPYKHRRVHLARMTESRPVKPNPDDCLKKWLYSIPPGVSFKWEQVKKMLEHWAGEDFVKWCMVNDLVQALRRLHSRFPEEIIYKRTGKEGGLWCFTLQPREEV